MRLGTRAPVWQADGERAPGVGAIDGGSGRPGRQARAAARRPGRARPAAAGPRGARSPRRGSAVGQRSGHTRARRTRTPAGATAPRASVAGARLRVRPCGVSGGLRDNRGAPSGSRRQQPVIGEQRSPGRRHERGEPFEQLQRIEQERGGAVAPGPSELVQELPARALRQPLQRQGRTHEVAAQLLQLVPAARRHGHIRMQAEALEPRRPPPGRRRGGGRAESAHGLARAGAEASWPWSDAATARANSGASAANGSLPVFSSGAGGRAAARGGGAV